LHGVYGDAKIDGKRGNDNVDMEGFLIDGSLTYVYFYLNTSNFYIEQNSAS